MRGPLGALAIITCLLLTACGGGDDGEAAEPTVTLPPTTTIDVPLAADRCADEPDPADYPEGGVPTAVRPCEVPTDDVVRSVVREGSGPASETGDGVIYHATVIRSQDGELVESSWADGRPHNLQSVGTGDEVPGVDESLVGVHAGEVLRLDLPADAAFGETPPTELPTVRAGDALTFVIEVLAVVPALDAADAPLDVDVAPSTDATEVTIDDLIVGDGKVVEEGDTVVVALLLARGDNEVVLVNSWHQQSPLIVPLDPALMTGPEPATLPGVFEGLQGARVGGRRVITMPPSEAWGDEGKPALGLPPGTDVIVVADILAAY